MKLEWLQDFLALVDTGTFSRAAAVRNVTQPAFSRRIQMLEAWLELELVDRRSQPVRLTPIARRYVPAFRILLHDISQLRTRMQAEDSGTVRITLTTQHSLTITRLPDLLRLIGAESTLKIDFSVRSENRDECVALFMHGNADLLLCMEEEHDLVLRLMPDTPRLGLGEETLLPVSAPDATGAPLHSPQGTSTLKLLAFPADSFLGRIMDKHVPGLMQRHSVEVIHESVFLAGVKEMVLAGLGMAWLPQSLIERELKAGELIPLADALPGVVLQLGLYSNPRCAHPDVIRQIYELLDQRGDQLPHARLSPSSG